MAFGRPFRGGRVLAVAGAPDDPRRFYFGSVNGGVWRSDDAGRTWAPIFDSVNVGSIGAIAVAPSSPKRSTSAPAKPTCAPTSRRALACSARTTAARAGPRSASPTRSRSAASSSIRAIPNARARRGARPSLRPERGARGVPLDRRRPALDQDPVQGFEHRRDRPRVRARTSRAPSMPRCGRRGGRRGTPIRRRAVPAAVSTSRSTGARPGASSPVTAFRALPAGSASPPALRNPGASMHWWIAPRLRRKN